MQVTEEKVEAAAKKLYEMRHLTRWEALGERSQDIYRVEARAMLRTAADLSEKGKARPMSETLIPTYAFRWFIDYDGERILQQKFHSPGGVGPQWVAVPEVDHDDADANISSGAGEV